MSADCPHFDWPDDEGYFRDFFRRAYAARVPLAGSLELTRRCNLRCVHCYLGPQERVHREAGREMTTAQVLSILDQVVEAGCFRLLITGGEPLLRSDFAEVYRYAKLAGLDVTVFTNGTPVTDRYIELFQELPPRMVEITLYGATAETYERITGVPGSFERCLAGIRRLHDGGVRLGLKTMLMTLNSIEFEAIEAIARGFGARFRFDPVINACLDGGREPLELRVAAAEAVRLEFADTERRERWLDAYARRSDFPPSDQLYPCGAGQTGFYVDALGNLLPCVMLPGFSYSLISDTFADGWAKMEGIRKLKVSTGNRCASCQLRVYCGHCPGLLALENDNPEIPSAYLCALGAERVRAITISLPEEKQP